MIKQGPIHQYFARFEVYWLCSSLKNTSPLEYFRTEKNQCSVGKKIAKSHGGNFVSFRVFPNRMASSKYSLSLVFVISVLCGSCVHAVELKGDSKLRSNRHKFNWGKTHGWHFQPPISGEEQRYLNWKVNNDEVM